MSLLQDEFAQADGLRYLNHAAVAPWPKRATRAVQSFSEENCRIGARDYPDWLMVERRLRERLARLLNAPTTADLALVKNTSEALSFVAFGLDWSTGDQVVISDQEFPSNRVVWQALERFGVDALQVPLNGPDPEGALIAALGPRTRLLSISAVQYATGLRLDLHRLGQECRKRGVLFCVDAIQSLGCLPLDVARCGIDFLSSDGHKWLCSVEGCGVFFCAARMLERLEPRALGWRSVTDNRDFDRYHLNLQPSAGRFGAHGRACSKAAEACSTCRSARRRPTICSPTGMPEAVKPAGTVAAGWPVKLNG